MSTEETTIDRLHRILDELDLTKYASLSEMLQTVFESSEKFTDFINGLNEHIAQEELITEKLGTLQAYIQDLPKEDELSEIVPFQKLDQVMQAVDRQSELVEANNEKIVQLDVMYKRIHDVYVKLKKDADAVHEYMEQFQTTPVYLSRYDDTKPILSIVDPNNSFSCKINTEFEYAAGAPLRFLEVSDERHPLTFYTPNEFIKGYVKSDIVVLEEGLETFYMFTGDSQTYDISIVNSMLPLEDSPEETEKLKDVTFEIVINVPDQDDPVSTTFDYYGGALGVTLYSGCRFSIRYKQNGTDASAPLKFPKYRKLLLQQVKVANGLVI